MASPWKFLARLVSPRRQQTQGNDSIEDVSPGVLPIAGSPERPQPFDESAALSSARGPSKKEASDFHTTLERDSAQVVENSGVSLAYGPPEVKEIVGAASVKRRRRAGRGKTVVAVSQTHPSARTLSDDLTALDEEIRILRGQLASKLRLQNVQLRKMLERFER